MLYLDTEFSRFRGDLISLALVSDQGGEFYGVLELPDFTHAWVQEHVVPVLDRAPESYEQFQFRLVHFLRQHQGEPIIADWPEDLAHLLNCLVLPEGRNFNVGELELRLIKSGDVQSAVPHNALADAQALMAWHKAEAA